MYRINKIENYVMSLNLPFGHDFEHARRVKNWAMLIAASLSYEEVALVEAAALMHDIGLSKRDNKKEGHAILGAKMAKTFLKSNKLFSNEEINFICQVIAFHNDPHRSDGILLDIIRDADILDLLGNIGISRALITKADLPLYDPKAPNGSTWRFSAKDFDWLLSTKTDPIPTIVDQLNFQISCYDNLKTKFAKEKGYSLMLTIVDYILGLGGELLNNCKRTA